MEVKDNLLSNVSAVETSDSDIFSELVRVSGLNPETDFQHCRLDGVNFVGSNLSEFNFDYSDLRRTIWGKDTLAPFSMRYSLIGKGADNVVGSDFFDFQTIVLSKSLWAERFFAFQLLVDNWGQTIDTLGVLLQILRLTKETYLPLCSYVYFTASYLNDEKSKKLCVDMANSGRSQTNIYRIRKLNRSADTNMKYFNTFYIKARYPGDLSQENMTELHDAVLYFLNKDNARQKIKY